MRFHSILGAVTALALLAPTVSHADPAIYGSLRLDVRSTSPDQGSTRTELADAGSRLGLRGSEDLGNGLLALYHVELRLRANRFNSSFSAEDNDVNGRLAYAGLRGGFGEVTLGTQNSLYKVGASGQGGFDTVDQFNELFANTFQGTGRVTHSAIYRTPGDLGPVRGALQLRADGGSGRSGVDDVQASVDARVSRATLGAVYFRDAAERDRNVLLYATVAASEALTLSATWEDYEVAGGGDSVNTYIAWRQGPNILRAGLARNNPDDAGSRLEWALGFEHRLGSRTRVWIEYNDIEDTASVASLGLRTDF